tara:strand:- start:21 stop:629 length:609 start_codon:yes stop_codon:yes gene_type:complete
MKGNVVVAFGSPDNCRLSDLALISAGNASSNSGSSTSQKRLRADCANSSSATNVGLWNSFKSPTQTQMRGGTTLDDEPEDDTFNVDTGDNNHTSAVTMDSPSNYSTGTYFMSRCWNLNSSFLSGTWEAAVNTGSIFQGSFGTTASETPLTTNYTVTFQGNNTGNGSVYIRQSLDGTSAWKKFFGEDSNDDYMGRVLASYSRT